MVQHQYGDFIKGRILFIEQYCQEHRMDYGRVIKNIEEETVNRVEAEDKKAFLREQLFGEGTGSSSRLPNWVDKVFLEATSQVLKGCQCPLYTTTSRMPCIPFEAARFNAKRQAETVFRGMFEKRSPQDWLKWSFPAVYKKCYGSEAGSKLKVIEINPKHFGVITDNTGLEKASRIDCSTVLGYIYGALEKLGAGDITITHKNCQAESTSEPKLCTFDITFEYPASRLDHFRRTGV